MARYIVQATKPQEAKLNKGDKPYEMTGKKVKVTLVKSTIACLKDQKATVEALGLHKIRQSNVFELNKAIEGMLFKVRHLVTVEEVK